MEFTAAWQELASYSSLEIIAVGASVLYIIWAAAENRWCWPAAFVGSVLFVVIFWRYRLLMDSALNFYYAIMAIYGWVVWNKKYSQADNDHGIAQWPASFHLFAVAAIAFLSILSGYLLNRYTDASFPYLDSFTTWASLLATWMLAHKILENWFYWIVIDATSIYLYTHKALYFTVFLFVIYIVLSVYGYYNWRNKTQSHVLNV